MFIKGRVRKIQTDILVIKANKTWLAHSFGWKTAFLYRINWKCNTPSVFFLAQRHMTPRPAPQTNENEQFFSDRKSRKHKKRSWLAGLSMSKRTRLTEVAVSTGTGTYSRIFKETPPHTRGPKQSPYLSSTKGVLGCTFSTAS